MPVFLNVSQSNINNNEQRLFSLFQLFLYKIGYKPALSTSVEVIDNTGPQENSVIQKFQDLFSDISSESSESGESRESNEFSVSENPPLTTLYNNYQLESNEKSSEEVSSLESYSLEQDGSQEKIEKQAKEPVINYI